MEPLCLLAGTWFWLPAASCSLCLEQSTKPPLLQPNPNQCKAAKGAGNAAVSHCPHVLQIPQKQGLRTPVPVLQSSRCTPWCLGRCRQGTSARSASLPPSCLCARLPRVIPLLNVGQCFISLCHSLLGYSKQLQGREGPYFALRWRAAVVCWEVAVLSQRGVSGCSPSTVKHRYQG